MATMSRWIDRRRLAAVLDRAGVVPAALALRRMSASPWITVLTYHRIASPDPTSDYDQDVVDASPDEFERQVVFLKRACSVISLEQLLAFRRNGNRLPPNPVLITFDDGYLDNHDVVLPILVKHGLTAVFFIATSYIEKRRMFWWDRLALTFKRSQKDAVELEYPDRITLSLRDGATALRTALATVKNRHDLDLDRFLEHVSTAAGVEISSDEERRRADGLLMTWDHVSALHRAGMDVQSHTVTHRVLQTLSPQMLDEELAGSRRVLEAVIGAPVRSISYPVGRPIKGAPHIATAVRAAGYELGFTNTGGVNRTSRFDAFDVARIPADAYADAHFRAMIALPPLGYRAHTASADDRT